MFPKLALALAVTAAFSAAPLSAQQLDYANQQQWQSVHDQSQSPIDIQTRQAQPADTEEDNTLVFRNTEAAGLKVVDNGHAIEIEVHGPDALIRGRHFDLVQIHFHAASEHTIDGEHFPLEGHYVFRAKDGRLAVVGVMYREGAPNPMAGEVLEELAEADEGEIEHEDIAEMLPAVKSYHHYLGSLTTPPLTENVEWYVLDQPVTLSAAQIRGFEQRYSRNNRMIQPLNGRPLIHAAAQH